ncbi:MULTISPECIES: glycerol kinase GlpK [Methylocaldum]|jgi:glycerol kinase|uniref:glycerol kinase GlpK n=1 Tax=unclassified Methylocaldum TaxID=2622260 RepID=UPI00098AFDDA|nr:glycerol kinase GlpK [Methylocaldum sp. 14B]MDV3243377.1 glycerol kinase GlpK [Methylocaldum sp.]
MPRYIAVIDQGTSSTRCILFDHTGRAGAMAQAEHRQFYPRPGWVEHDPLEIWRNAQAVVVEALRKAEVEADEIVALGVTNQRETLVVWDKITGKPVYPAIVWQDTRSAEICERLAIEGGQDRFRARTGLPIATYFSGPKLQWLLDNVEEARIQAERGELLCGTIDSWLVWSLTGGKEGGAHVTDVSNASRTLLMNLETLAWDEELLAAMNIPASILPTIRSSSEIYGVAQGALAGVPVAGILGDQQAALFGQTCFAEGEAKNTYGTGCFMLLNTGLKPVQSRHGLITTVAYQLGGAAPIFALEGSIAVTGALVQWLRDNLELIRTSAEVESLANTVEDNGGIYIVPAFSGLFAPYWRSDARGIVIGLTRYVNKGHFARAALEATAYQTRDIVDAMRQETGLNLDALKADGGMVVNETLMQFQSDILGTPVIRPIVTETTALGAAYAAGLAVGFWTDIKELRDLWRKDKEWQPRMTAETRERLYAGWSKAVERTFGWLD